MSLRGVARGIFVETMARVRLAEVMRERVWVAGGRLHLCGMEYELAGFRRVVVIAAGKAAGPMAEAVWGVVGGAPGTVQEMWGIVVGPVARGIEDARVRYFPGSHPFPDAGARQAADAVLEVLERCDEACLVIFLVSGGASAMLEWALDDRVTDSDVTEFHRALVRSGLAIGEMNTLRKHFSRVKGGRLAVAANGATQCTLLVSDVPAGRLDVIGSGPSLPDRSTIEDCRRILREQAVELPGRVREFFAGAGLVETPKIGDGAFARSRWTSVLSSDDLCEKARELAEGLGFFVVVDNACDEWEYREAAGYLVGRLEALRAVHGRVCLISAGEVSVRLPEGCGVGGRNQQFVLACARRLGGRGVVLSAGSDGVDGNSPAAGGVVDETTLGRAAAVGLSVEEALARFDAYPLLAGLGDAIVTGRTGNNVRDLRVLLSDSLQAPAAATTQYGGPSLRSG